MIFKGNKPAIVGRNSNVIMGAGDIIKPAAPNLVMLGPAFIYFASWYILGVIGFWAFGPETKGRTLEELEELWEKKT